MFHFPGCPPHELWIHSWVTGHCPGRVPPFGYLRINVYLQLPAAFRSLSRPSSAISALASTLRSSSLDLASTTIPFLRLLRWDDNLICELFSLEAFDWNLGSSLKQFSECLPCAVFKVRARLPPRPCGRVAATRRASQMAVPLVGRFASSLACGLSPLPLAAALSHGWLVGGISLARPPVIESVFRRLFRS